MSSTQSNTGNGLRKFWLIWISCLLSEFDLLGQTSENIGHVLLSESDSRTNECTDINGTTTEYPNTRCIRGSNVPQSNEYPVRRSFSGVSNDVLIEFIQYFENIFELNVWNNGKARRVPFSTLRGQTEIFAYWMPLIFQRDYEHLKQMIEEIFGQTAME
ncbi:unnamed protein product [Mytilus coruscus]|uniref:Uncharacterized protein n=1 Tax=Mytilus coruscus TaxID=42192 RepID=A0A6J8BD48_MYTCO|nr:unnamed protein product [Mytilus coruscus]